MAQNAVMKITLYDENSEEKKTFTRTFVPWRLLKKAIQLSKTLNLEQVSEEDLDSLAGLVVEAFGDQFSLDELNDGADITEMVTVLQIIMTRAGGSLGGNPTKPGS